MKKALVFILILGIVISSISCNVSNKTILRAQKLEEGVSNPTTVEELKDAIEKYQRRVSFFRNFSGAVQACFQKRQDMSSEKMLF